MANKKQTLPTNKTNIIAASLSAFVVLTFGVLLVLAGARVIPVELSRFWWPALCVAIWLCGFITGTLRKDSIVVWVSTVFLGLGTVYFIEWGTEYGYDKLYACFIAIPVLCSLLTLPVSQDKNLHLKIIILFTGLSIAFFLNAFLELNIFLAIGIAVIVLGLFMFINILTSKRGRWDDGDRPQRKR